MVPFFLSLGKRKERKERGPEKYMQEGGEKGKANVGGSSFLGDEGPEKHGTDLLKRGGAGGGEKKEGVRGSPFLVDRGGRRRQGKEEGRGGVLRSYSTKEGKRGDSAGRGGEKNLRNKRRAGDFCGGGNRISHSTFLSGEGGKKQPRSCGEKEGISEGGSCVGGGEGEKRGGTHQTSFIGKKGQGEERGERKEKVVSVPSFSFPQGRRGGGSWRRAAFSSHRGELRARRKKMGGDFPPFPDG